MFQCWECGFCSACQGFSLQSALHSKCHTLLYAGLVNHGEPAFPNFLGLYEKIQKFMDRIPDHCTFIFLHKEVHWSWTNNSESTFNFYVLADTILETDIDVHHCLHASSSTLTKSSGSQPPPHSSIPSSASSQPSSIPDTSLPHHPSGSNSSCNPVTQPQALIAVLDLLLDVSPTTTSISSNIFDDVVLPTVLDDDTNSNSLPLYDLPSDSVSPIFHAFVSSTDLVIFASISSRFNAILDSRCMTHIICDRHIFWSYHENLTVPVGTANCGKLNTLVHGEVCFWVFIDDQPIILILSDCLHALDMPINLLSVGFMTDCNLELCFNKETTTIYFSELSQLRGKSLQATVPNCLSFLHCDFVLPGFLTD